MANASKSSKITTNHEEIKQWVEARDGKPSSVKGTGNPDKDDAGLLRINFPGRAEDSLEDITWDEFFEKFEENKLAFLYQDDKQNGDTSYFNKFVNRDKK